MGVIHKLKEEVVHYIVDQKKNNPSLSCRAITRMVNERFQLHVSKSSVNTIIKNAQMSSAVGRRSSSQGKEKKFQIPSQKKKQLLEQVIQAKEAIEPALEKPPSKQIPKMSPKAEPVSFPEAKPILQKKIISPEVEKEEPPNEKAPEETRLPLLPDPLEEESLPQNLPMDNLTQEEQRNEDKNLSVQEIPQEKAAASKDAMESSIPASSADDLSTRNLSFSKNEFLNSVEQLRSENRENREPLYDNMGLVFLLAAQWEISRTSVLGEVFRKYTLQPPNPEFDRICSVLVLLKMLGISSAKEIELSHHNGLWALAGFHDIPEANNLLEWMSKVQDAKKILADYNFKKDQALLEITRFDLILEDGARLSLDARLTTLWEENVSKDFSWPIDKGMEFLSKYIISNIKSPLFLKLSGSEGFLKDFLSLVTAFEGFPGKKITKIESYNHQNEKIASFSTIPTKQRNFVCGVYPWQEQFKELTKSARWGGKRPFYHKHIDKILYYSTARAKVLIDPETASDRDFRMLTLWDEAENSEPRMAILTNDEEESTEEIISSFVLRWPNLEKIVSSSEKRVESGPIPFREGKSEQEKFDQLSSLWEFFEDFGQTLHKYCMEHFFFSEEAKLSATDYLQTCYGVSGFCYQKENFLKADLIISADFEHQQEIQTAVQRVNESYIADPMGRRLFISLLK